MNSIIWNVQTRANYIIFSFSEYNPIVLIDINELIVKKS